MKFAFHLDTSQGQPIYRQLVQRFEQAIESGRLQPGDNVPTTREMADQLQVARGTVVKAYNELLAKGYLVGKQGQGTFVNKRLQQFDFRPQIDSDLLNAMPPSLSAFGQRLMSLQLDQRTSFDLPELDHGCGPRQHLPIARWRELLSRHCHPARCNDLEFALDPFGDLSLREAVTRYLIRTKGISCEPDQIIVFAGTQRIFDYVLSLLVNPGETIAIEDPGYVGIRDNAIVHGASLLPLPIDNCGLITSNLLDLNESCKLLHTTPDCQDPTGVKMSTERKEELVEWACKSGTYLLEDAWDCDYHYGAPIAPCLQSMCPQRTLYIYTPWKVLYPLTTIGFLVAPRHLLPVCRRLKVITERQVPVLESRVLTDFIAEGHLDKHIDSVSKIYRQRRQSLIFALKTYFRDKIKVSSQTAGLHLKFSLAASASDVHILALAKSLHVPLVSLKHYYLGPAPDGEFIMQFSLETMDLIAPRIAEMARLLLA